MSSTSLVFIIFSFEIIWGLKILFKDVTFWNFKIWIDQSLSNEKMRNTKVVDINNSNNFYIHEVF